MKKIITAIGNEKLNRRLKETEKYKIVARDIQYKEGILEVLNNNSNIDIIIISEILEGNIDFKELISIIKQINEKIEIIVFLDYENVELKSFLFSLGISKIYINNEIDIETFIINLEDNITDKTKELNEEIKKLKEIIKNNQEKSKQDKKQGDVIAICGAYGSGKSIIACLTCKKFSKQSKKTLLIDFDIFNSSINVIYNVLKYNSTKKTYLIKEQIIQIAKNEHLLCAMDLIFSDEKTIDYINLENLIEELRKEYDEIIIDTTSNFKYKYLQKILHLADEIIYIVVPSISEIKKALSLYEIYIKDFQIPTQKMKILINKDNKYSVDDSIISKIFNVKKIIKKVKYMENIEVKLLS